MAWEYKRISEVTKTSAGGTPLKSHKEYYINGDIPWLQSGEVGTKDITVSKNFITKDGLNNSSAKIFPENTVLVAMYGATAGEVGILRFKAATNQAVCGILPSDKLLPEFVYYFFLYHKAKLIEQAVGNAQPNISQEKIKNTKIPILPICDQKRIVLLLDKVFADIDKIYCLTKKNLKNAKILFDSYLNKLVAMDRDEWNKTTIEALVEDGILFKPLDGNHGEIHPKSSDYVADGVPFIMASDIKNDSVDLMGCKFIKKSQAESLRKGFAQDGDVLLSHKATIGQCAILKTDHEYVMLTPQVTYYRIKDKSLLFNKYLYYYFKSPLFQKELNKYAGVGTTRAYIGITRQLKLSFAYPSLDKQKSIVSKLDNIFPQTKRINDIYNKKIAYLTELKKSILNTIFTCEHTKYEVTA